MSQFFLQLLNAWVGKKQEKVKKKIDGFCQNRYRGAFAFLSWILQIPWPATVQYPELINVLSVVHKIIYIIRLQGRNNIPSIFIPFLL
jgi:hypothetical protein